MGSFDEVITHKSEYALKSSRAYLPSVLLKKVVPPLGDEQVFSWKPWHIVLVMEEERDPVSLTPIPFIENRAASITTQKVRLRSGGERTPMEFVTLFLLLFILYILVSVWWMSVWMSVWMSDSPPSTSWCLL